MLKKLLAIAALALSSGAYAQTQGTDAFGYQWVTSADLTGPTYDWIDISTTGTPVTGFTDDNFLGPFNIGFNYQYFTSSYNQVYIGSNGFISFGGGYNYASGRVGTAGNGFLPFPSNDAKNNDMAPLLADLTFIRTNGQPVTTAHCYYQTIGSKFIVSFEGVPFWNSATSAGFNGANSFQIILDNADTSFTYQYRQISGVPDADYTDPIVRGYEDANAQYGSNFRPVRPVALSAVKVKYPSRPLVSFPDLGILGSFTPSNKGAIRPANFPGSVTSFVTNAGLVPISQPFDVTLLVVDPVNTNIVFQDTVTIPGLARGESSQVTFSDLPLNLSPGDYSVIVAHQYAHDTAVTSNNTKETELVIVSIDSTDNVYGYDSKIYDATATTNVDRGQAGIYLTPPNYPVNLKGFDMDIGWVSGDFRDSASTVVIRIYDDNGPSGAPGTLLATDSITYDEKDLGDSISVLNLNNPGAGKISRHRKMFAAPVNVTDGGIYMGIFYHGPTTGFFWNSAIRDENGPFSYRDYEIQGANGWGEHRDNGTFDYAIRGVFGSSITSAKPSMLAARFSMYPNPAHGSATISGDAHKAGTTHLSVVDVNGKVVYTHSFNTAKGANRLAFSTSTLNPGVYVARLSGGMEGASRLIVR